MSKLITIAKAKEDVSLDLHFIPCHLKEDHNAAVSTFFLPSINDHPELDKVKTASFRGRPLLGTEVKVHEGYQGDVLENCDEEHGKQFNIDKTFHSFKLWNWDQIPSKDDKIVRAMDWCAIAEAIHAPVVSCKIDIGVKHSASVSPKQRGKI